MAKKHHNVLVQVDLKHKDFLQTEAAKDHRKLANLASKIIRDYVEERLAAKAKPRTNGQKADHVSP